jgi:hypothetical protein
MKCETLNLRKTDSRDSKSSFYRASYLMSNSIVRCYNTTLRAIIPLPDLTAPPTSAAHLNAYQEFPTGSTVMALYPDTSCFYRAEVISSPRDLQPVGRVRSKLLLHLSDLITRRALPKSISPCTSSSLKMMMTKSILSLHNGLLNGLEHDFFNISPCICSCIYSRNF